MNQILIDALDALYDQPGPTRDTNPSGARLTYPQLETRDQRLAALRVAIDTVGRTSGDFCAHHWWYGRAGFKTELTRIVGHFADQDDAALTTNAAYDAAYQTLYHRLPDCRHEGMCWKGRQ